MNDVYEGPYPTDIKLHQRTQVLELPRARQRGGGYRPLAPPLSGQVPPSVRS